MAKWDALKDAVAEVVRQNGSGAITGTNLQGILLSIINSLGENMNFAGIATPETNPGSLSDGGVFYIALTPGTYSNFGGEILTDENLPGLFIYDPDNGGMSYTSLNAATKAELKSISVDIGIFNSIKALTDKLNALPGTFPDILYGRFHGILQDASLGTAVPFKLYQSKVFNGSYAFQTLSIGVSQGTLLGTETSYTEQKNFYRRARRSSGAWVWDAWQSADTATQFDLQALRDRVTALETDEHNEVKQFIFTTKQLLYRRIDIVLPNWIANEGFAAWVHTRRQHYLLSSASALFSPTDGQLYEIGTAYNDLPVGTTGGDVHIKMVIRGKNNLVRLYIAVEPYNYVQIETAAQVTFVGSSAEEFNSIVPTTTCRSLDIANLLSTLQEQGTNILSLQQSTFTGVNRPEGYTLTWHTKSGGDRSATIPAYGEAGTTNVDGLKGLGQNVALIDQWFIQDLLAEIQESGGVDLGNYVTKTELEEKGYITDKPGKTLHAQNIIPDIDSLEPDAEYSTYVLGAAGRGRWLRAHILEVLADYIEAQNIGSKDKSKTVKILGQDVVIDADGWIQCLQTLRFGATYSSTNEPEFGIDPGGDATLNSLELKDRIYLQGFELTPYNPDDSVPDRLMYDGYVLLDAHNYSEYLDSAYIKKSDGTMTGQLRFTGSTYPHILGNGSVLVLSGTSATNQLVLDYVTKSVRPSGSNAQSLGNSTNRWSNVYSVLGNFSDQITSSVANGTAPFVVASKTLVSNLNADLLDGYHESSFFRYRGSVDAANVNCDDVEGFGMYSIGNVDVSNTGYPTPNGNMLNFRASTGLFQILSNYSGSSVWIRSRWYNNETAWRKIAYTSSNVASATKLATAKTLWGQSFDGSANISGNLTGVGNITGTGAVTINSVNNVVALKYNGQNASSVAIWETKFGPYNEANGLLDLGATSARWKGIYGQTLDLTDSVSLGTADTSTGYKQGGHVVIRGTETETIIASNGGNMVFRPIGNTSISGQMSLLPSGNLKVGYDGGLTDNGYKLDVNGTFHASGDATIGGTLTVNGKNIEELGAGTLSLYSSYADDCLASGIYYDAYTDDYGNGKLLVVATAANSDGFKAVEQTFYAEGGAIFKRILLINVVGAILESMEWRSIAG